MTFKALSSQLLLVAGLLVVSASSTGPTTTFESFSSTEANSESNLRGNAMGGMQRKGPCSSINGQELYKEHPLLCEFLDRLEAESDVIAGEMTAFAREKNLLVGENFDWDARRPLKEKKFLAEDQLPVVFAHGMGDSCFNSGMGQIGDHTSELLGGVYVTCVPTGDTQTEDTTNGYFLNMDKSVDVFASKIAKDPKLQNGFHAIGFSQGNNVIRGYIARYNTPIVHTFLAVNGVNAGEGTVPGCFPNSQQPNTSFEEEEEEEQHQQQQQQRRLGSICDLLVEQASKRAYTEFAQEHSFQANYWRDPRESKKEEYYKYSQLARWNNEGPNNHNQTYNENFAKTSKFVWVMATDDSMVWPPEGEHWGAPDSSDGKDPFRSPVLPMNQTEWYQKDLFGLKTAQEAGKNVFETFEGDHLRFSMEDFDRWVNKYLLSSSSSTSEAVAE